MREVIVVRPGQHANGRLTWAGEKKIRKLTTRILRKTRSSQSIILFYPPTVPATETVNIIAPFLECPAKTYDVPSWSEFSDGESIASTVNHQLDDDEPDILIVVAHHEAPAGILYQYGSSLDNQMFFCLGGVGPGEALVLDVEKYVVSRLNID